MKKNKTMKIEMTTYKEAIDRWFSCWLELPAEEYEIEDAFQRARITNENEIMQFVVYDCELMPSIQGKRLDSPSLYELDFLARRLADLTEEERIVIKAIDQKYIPQEEDTLISIKDCINLTYGIDKVPIASNIRNLKELGEFAIENELSPIAICSPNEIVPYLDREEIGQLQQDAENGVFVDGKYVITSSYEKQEVYDGNQLPNVDLHTNYAFGLEVARRPKNDDDIEKAIENSKWIYLPIDKKEANNIAKELGQKKIEDCVYFDFKSIIPQIESDNFGNMQDFDKLNSLAEILMQMKPSDQAKFKAVLQAEEPQKMDGIIDVVKNLKQYEFAPQIESADHFFKEYLKRHLSKNFDARWVESLYTLNEGKELIEKLNVKNTDYGIVSARGDRLFKNVMKNNNDYPLMNQKYELIEVCGQKALFANERISVDDIPQGLIRYEMREGDSLCFASIEKNVSVNHAGTIIVKEPLDFECNNYIILDDDNKSPNFLGEETTVKEFMETDYEQEELTQKMGGL